MAFMRTHFEVWADSYPEEPGDRPTEEEMAEFEDAEEKHRSKVRFFVGVGNSRRIFSYHLFSFLV
jgi:hypothetical protein